MAKDPAFLFYSSDFLTGTMLLNNEQVGIYIRLLCLQHQSGRICEEDMINMCGTHLKHIIKKFSKDADGNYYNFRLEEETVKRKNYSESRSKNRNSPQIKPLKRKPVKEIDISKSYVAHMENENEDVIVNKKEIEIENNNKSAPEKIWNSLDCKFSEKTKEIWVKLCAISKWKKKEYTALELSLKKLMEYEEDFSVGLMEKTITGNYQGIIFNDTEAAYEKWQKARTPPSSTPNLSKKELDKIFK